jgi:hypothetical protein
MMLEMEKLQARGEVPEEELKALEEDVTGKVRNSTANYIFF